MFHRKRRSPKHKTRPNQLPTMPADTPGPVFRRPQDFLDGDMAQRLPTQGRHRGPYAPLPGEIVGVRPVVDPPTRFLPTVQSDATVQMPAASAIPPSVMAAQPEFDPRGAQSRVAATLSDPTWPMRRTYLPPPSGEWFRVEPDTTATDRSLAEFHKDWARRMKSENLPPWAGPQTMLGTIARVPAGEQVPR